MTFNQWWEENRCMYRVGIDDPSGALKISAEGGWDAATDELKAQLETMELRAKSAENIARMYGAPIGIK